MSLESIVKVECECFEFQSVYVFKKKLFTIKISEKY